VGWTCGTHGEGRGAYRVLVGRPEGKRPLGRPRRRWEGNMKMDLREADSEGVDWIHLAQDRVQWGAVLRMEMKLWVSQNAGNFLLRLATLKKDFVP